MSRILDIARADFAEFTGGEDGGTDISFRPLPSSTPVIVKGLASKHHLNVDSEGLQVNAKNAHIAVSESLLVEAGYTVRNADNEVEIKGHLINFLDSAGIDATYKIEQTQADETLGMIYIILGDYE